MDKNYEIEISENLFTKLREISRVLNISISDLIRFSINELFDLIQSDTGVFLDSIGISEKLKEIIEN